MKKGIDALLSMLEGETCIAAGVLTEQESIRIAIVNYLAGEINWNELIEQVNNCF